MTTMCCLREHAQARAPWACGCTCHQPAYVLSDDGTLDTVIRCMQCGRDERYTWDGEGFYDSFVDWAFTDAETSHVCEST